MKPLRVRPLSDFDARAVAFYLNRAQMPETAAMKRLYGRLAARHHQVPTMHPAEQTATSRWLWPIRNGKRIS